MVPLAQLWLPIIVSAVLVFIASSVLHMVFKFWHSPDYRGFTNEDEVGAAIRKGHAAPGMYMIPFCSREAMKKPHIQEKFNAGPVGVFYLRRNGQMNLGKALCRWFAFCLLVGLFCAFVTSPLLAEDEAFERVFHFTTLTAFMGYGFGQIPTGIWHGQPWGSVIKQVMDGLIYAVITGSAFAWLWPH